MSFIIEKINRCKNNLENLSATKVNKHIPSGFSLSTISSFRSIGNKHDVYRVYWAKCTWLWLSFYHKREHAIKIINFKKEKTKLLKKEQQESYENAKFYDICKEKIDNKCFKDKKYHKVRDRCHYTGQYSVAPHSICKTYSA